MRQIHAPFGDAHAPWRGRSSLQFPAYAGAGLLKRTRVFRDRVLGNGGSIEEGALGGLYDPILRKVKEWGLLGDLVFFGAASAVENNSGSIPTIFDASGNEYDATQSDTAKQPALDKNSVGGRWGAGFDGADDDARAPTNPLTLTNPFTVVSLWRSNDTTVNTNAWAVEDSSDTEFLGCGHRQSKDLKLFTNGETPGSGSTLSTDTPYIVSVVWDGTDFNIYLDGTLDYVETPSSKNWQTATDQFHIGRNNAANFSWDGIVFNTLAIEATGVRDEIETRLSGYYSL